jgi:hypothetical protein
VCAGRGGGRDGVVLSVVRPVRAADSNYPRAKGPRHDNARPFDDGSRDDRADGVSDALFSEPLSLAHGVPDSLTRNIEADIGGSATRRARRTPERLRGGQVGKVPDRGRAP